MEFAFKNICYSISAAKKDEPDVDVLRDVSGSVQEGELLAIVGPSGAGKTILLDTLTFNKGPGAPSGEISLNGKKMTRADFAKDAIYVPREDNLWLTMSPRSTPLAQDTARPPPRRRAAGRWTSSRASPGSPPARTPWRAGSCPRVCPVGRGRLSLAVAPVKQPSLIVLDEPTSPDRRRGAHPDPARARRASRRAAVVHDPPSVARRLPQGAGALGRARRVLRPAQGERRTLARWVLARGRRQPRQGFGFVSEDTTTRRR